MTTRVPFHSAERPGTIGREIRKAVENGKITQEDARVIDEYIMEMKAVKQWSAMTASTSLSKLITFRILCPVPLKDISLSDIYRFIEDTKERYTTQTRKTTIQAVKLFSVWATGEGYCALPVEKIRAIQLPKITDKTHQPDELLTEEEVQMMITCAQSSRDRALIATLYESGCRVGELARLKWRDLHFTREPVDGVKVYITDTKENQTRFVWLMYAKPFLIENRNNTMRSEPDDPVFTTVQRRPMQYQTIVNVIKRLTDEAGIQKAVSPHLFRHSRITHLITQGVPEAIIKLTMWNNLNTKMFETYVSLAESDVEDALTRAAGLEARKPKEKTVTIRPRECHVCGHLNVAPHRFCGTCGTPITIQAKISLEDTEKFIEELPEYQRLQELIEQKVREMTMGLPG